jgi:Kef-type K+ transport system membrane component KefB
MGESVLFSVFLIFTGAALLATLALYARQSLLIAYIVLGVLAGPSGVGLIDDPHLIEEIAHVGIIFLLFLLGLELRPSKLVDLLREAIGVTIASTLVFALLGYLVAAAAGFSRSDCLLIGVATTLSSTIISLKLLPTTVLHHRHTGEVIISILLLQDLLAIAALLLLHGLAADQAPWREAGLLLVALPVLLFGGLAVERWLLRPLFLRFDKVGEYVFLLVLGWCLGIAQLAQSFGLSYEIGAFIAGVALANSPIAPFIADSLRPLRDFFLVMFFFALGAGFNVETVSKVWPGAVALALAVVVIKPLTFRTLFRTFGETGILAGEAGVRLGQMSEFSLLLVAVALQTQVMSASAAAFVQLATLVTFVISSSVVVLRYPTPIALSDRLRRD